MSDILDFARKFHALSVWSDEPFEEGGVLAFLESLKANESAYFKQTESGVIGGMLMPLWFAPATIIAVELFWYSEQRGEGRALREEFESWARTRGAKYMQFSGMVNDRHETLIRALGRAGYTPVETGFRKAL